MSTRLLIKISGGHYRISLTARFAPPYGECGITSVEWRRNCRIFHCSRDSGRVEIVDNGGLLESLKRHRKGALIVSAHYGNWELGCIPDLRKGLVPHTVYRVSNNPGVDRLITMLRAPAASGNFIPKGRKGLWEIVAALRRQDIVGMLVDQKLKERSVVPFFGRDARTTDAPAILSQRFGVCLVLLKVERLVGARHRITISRFRPVHATHDKAQIVGSTRQLIAILEKWIRERPDHWLWAHRRWHN